MSMFANFKLQSPFAQTLQPQLRGGLFLTAVKGATWWPISSSTRFTKPLDTHNFFEWWVNLVTLTMFGWTIVGNTNMAWGVIKPTPLASYWLDAFDLQR